MVVCAESFIVCKRLSLPAAITSESLMAQLKDCQEQSMSPAERLLIPFLTSGDLSGYD